jgi:phenylacetate-CoA ligase
MSNGHDQSARAQFYDARETRDPEQREAELSTLLPQLVARAKEYTPAFSELLHDVDPQEVRDRAALARLPVVRKSELTERQRRDLPFGGLLAVDIHELARIFSSPGPIYDPESGRSDYWRFGRALFATGFRRRDIVHNAFSYHLTPGGWMVDSGARVLGCPVIPAGTGNTEWQIRVIADVRPAGYAGTPSFLKTLLERGREAELDLSSLSKALVSGEALPDSLRAEFAEQGVTVQQCYATADVGLIAYESSVCDGLLVDEDVIVEIVRPGTGDPVPEGEVGEVLVTVFNDEYPLIRFGTGDLSAVHPGLSGCGRTNMRLKGWLGRADQATKVRGQFVHPHQVAEVARRHPEIRKARLVVSREDGRDAMTLRCEAEGDPGELANRIAESLRAVTGLRGEVEVASSGSLPNDGKVIEDARGGA